MSNREQSAFRTVAAVALVLAFVLLVVAHSAHPHSWAFAGFLLLPVFLFGTLEIPRSLWSISQASETTFCSITALSSRFQRPPPFALI